MSNQSDQAWLAAAAGVGSGLAPGALDAFPHPAAILDAEGGVTAANSSFSAEMGLAVDDGSRAADALIAALAGEPGQTVTLPGREGARLVDLLVLPLVQPGSRLVMVIDRTVDMHMRSALAISRRRFKELVEISSDHAWETGADGAFSMLTPRGLAGREGQTLIGVLPASLFAPQMPAPAMSPFSTPVPVDEVEVWLSDPAGGSVCFEVSAVPLFDKDGVWSGARGICRDVTRDRRYRAHMAEHLDHQRVFARITNVFRAEANPDDMLRMAASASTHGFGAHGCHILTAPPSAKRDGIALKLAPAASFGKIDESVSLAPVLDALLAEDSPDVQVVPYGEWSVLAARTIYAARPVGAILLWRGPNRPAWNDGDKTLLHSVAGQLAAAVELRGNYHALFDISRSDPLTGVLNRRGFYDEVKRRFSRMQRSPSAATLLYCDLDNFKLVNDIHGHAKGDEALRHVADILRNNSRSTDLVARLGGDEFAVWLDSASEPAAIGRAQVFLTAAKSLRSYSGSHNRPLTLSIGMAVYESHSRETINEFLSRADAAMYSVKRDGKGHYAIAPSAKRS